MRFSSRSSIFNEANGVRTAGRGFVRQRTQSNSGRFSECQGRLYNPVSPDTTSHCSTPTQLRRRASCSLAGCPSSAPPPPSVRAKSGGASSIITLSPRVRASPEAPEKCLLCIFYVSLKQSFCLFTAIEKHETILRHRDCLANTLLPFLDIDRGRY